MWLSALAVFTIAKATAATAVNWGAEKNMISQTWERKGQSVPVSPLIQTSTFILLLWETRGAKHGCPDKPAPEAYPWGRFWEWKERAEKSPRGYESEFEYTPSQTAMYWPLKALLGPLLFSWYTSDSPENYCGASISDIRSQLKWGSKDRIVMQANIERLFCGKLAGPGVFDGRVVITIRCTTKILETHWIFVVSRF